MSSSNSLFPYDKDELIHSLQRFDGEIIVQDEVDSPPKSDNSRYMHTGLLEVLLECVCANLVKDASQREILLSELCKQLSQLNFINEDLLLHTLPLRKELSKVFFDYVRQICGQVIPEAEVDFSSVSFLDDNYSSFDKVYKTCFDELEEIGRGGFGIVCKARSKMTNTVYAVKKILFNYKNDSRLRRVIREAKNIALLSHPNVVHYENAWTEAPSEDDNFNCSFNDKDSNSISSYDECDTAKPRKEVKRILINEYDSYSTNSTYSSRLDKSKKITRTNFKRLQEETHTEDSGSIVFSKFVDESFKNVAWSFGSRSENKTETSNSNSADSQKSDASDGSDSENSDDSINLNVKAILFIQMEYCDCDLRYWLDERATGNPLPFEKDAIEIFIDILKGVMHIHSKCIIHRDLKPQNIFYSKSSNTLKIGDFGLATLAGCSEEFSEDDSLSDLHSSNIGTLPYAAPEQIKGQSYDSKVDIFSLGIILLELLNNFSTVMELSRSLSEIKNGNFPREMKSPNYKHLVKNLVNENPLERMSAKEILDHLQEDSKVTLEDTDVALHKILYKKELELKEKDATIREKDEEILRLKAELNELKSIYVKK